MSAGRWLGMNKGRSLALRFHSLLGSCARAGARIGSACSNPSRASAARSEVGANSDDSISWDRSWSRVGGTPRILDHERATGGSLVARVNQYFTQGMTISSDCAYESCQVSGPLLSRMMTRQW